MTDPIHAMLHKMLDEIEKPARAKVIAALAEEIHGLYLSRQEAHQLLQAIHNSLEEQYTQGQLYFVAEGIEGAQKALKEMDQEEDPE